MKAPVETNREHDPCPFGGNDRRPRIGEDRVKGFSTNTAFPAPAARVICAACRLCGVANTTASIAGSRRITFRSSTHLRSCSRQKSATVAAVRVCAVVKRIASLCRTESTRLRPHQPRPTMAARIARLVMMLPIASDRCERLARSCRASDDGQRLHRTPDASACHPGSPLRVSRTAVRRCPASPAAFPRAPSDTLLAPADPPGPSPRRAPLHSQLLPLR